MKLKDTLSKIGNGIKDAWNTVKTGVQETVDVAKTMYYELTGKPDPRQSANRSVDAVTSAAPVAPKPQNNTYTPPTPTPNPTPTPIPEPVPGPPPVLPPPKQPTSDIPTVTTPTIESNACSIPDQVNSDTLSNRTWTIDTDAEFALFIVASGLLTVASIAAPVAAIGLAVAAAPETLGGSLAIAGVVLTGGVAEGGISFASNTSTLLQGIGLYNANGSFTVSISDMGTIEEVVSVIISGPFVLD